MTGPEQPVAAGSPSVTLFMSSSAPPAHVSQTDAGGVLLCPAAGRAAGPATGQASGPLAGTVKGRGRRTLQAPTGQRAARQTGRRSARPAGRGAERRGFQQTSAGSPEGRRWAGFPRERGGGRGRAWGLRLAHLTTPHCGSPPLSRMPTGLRLSLVHRGRVVSPRCPRTLHAALVRSPRQSRLNPEHFSGACGQVSARPLWTSQRSGSR